MKPGLLGSRHTHTHTHTHIKHTHTHIYSPVFCAVGQKRLPVSGMSVEVQFVIDPSALGDTRTYGVLSIVQADTGGAATGNTYQKVIMNLFNIRITHIHGRIRSCSCIRKHLWKCHSQKSCSCTRKHRWKCHGHAYAYAYHTSVGISTWLTHLIFTRNGMYYTKQLSLSGQWAHASKAVLNQNQITHTNTCVRAYHNLTLSLPGVVCSTNLIFTRGSL